MPSSLLDQRFLFRFAVPCRYRHPLQDRQISVWDEAYRLPHLAELAGESPWVEAHAAWNQKGLAFSFLVSGKKQSPWCRAQRGEDSDGVQIWIDTRDVHNVHRATRFCHRFLFLPAGGGAQFLNPVAQWLPIHRAREHPLAIRRDQIQVRSRIRSDGYLLEAFLAAPALTGFDPEDHPRVGFNYCVSDRERGLVTFTTGSPLPYQEDPSVWASLELVPQPAETKPGRSP